MARTSDMTSLSLVLALAFPALAAAAPVWSTTPAVPGDRRITLNLLRTRVTGIENLKSYEFQVSAAAEGGAIAWSAKVHARPRGISHPSGFHGGGQVNAIVKTADGTMVAGGDVAGFQRSLDGGETWFQSSRGVFRGKNTRNVTSLAYDRASGAIYGLCGGDSNGNL